MFSQQRRKLIVGSCLLLALASLPSYFSVKNSVNHDVLVFICDLVETKFYEHSTGLEEWAKLCRGQAKEIGFWENTRTVLSRIQVQMRQLGISHLEVYTPSEDRRLWEGQGKDNGIHARLIEDRFVVTKVLPGSVAEIGGVQVGDIVEQLDGEAIHSLWQIAQGRGFFGLIRGEKEFRVFMEPRELQLDSSPSVRPYNANTGVLEISSFRSAYFEKESWQNLVREMAQYKNMILDVRENSGGSFVAMLRALSPFFCKPTVIGRLVQPRKKSGKMGNLEDNLAEEYQLTVLEQASELKLETFADYGCFNGPVRVLTNYQTASVSEIFAYAFRIRAESQVWGESTAGDVVLAVWYAIPQLPRGYSLSIPEALVLTHDEMNLEGQGVWPERELYYKLSEGVQGKDSWLEAASRW